MRNTADISKAYAQSIVILGNTETAVQRAEELVDKQAEGFPDRFSGRRRLIPFKLRYVPPFDKGFTELKRLQGVAADYAGFSDEYRGCIAIDLSEYLAHENELYFDISLKFLYDMSDYWGYVFLIDNDNERETRAMLGKLFSIMDNRHIEIVEQPKDRQPDRCVVGGLCKKYTLACTEQVMYVLSGLADPKAYPEGFVDTVIRELAFAHRSAAPLDLPELKEFISGSAMVKYLLNAKQNDCITNTIEECECLEFDQAI